MGLPLAVGIALTSCAGSGGDPFLTSCSVAKDQASAYKGRWQSLYESGVSVPIAFHSGDFTSTEMSQMVAAAQTWNAFFNASMGSTYIDFGDASNPRVSTLSKQSTDCTVDSSIISSSGTFTSPVVIYKDHTWPADFGGAAIAVTTTCVDQTPTIHTLWLGFIEVNYQNFFGSNAYQPDLQSVILHEFGHLAGLMHSCSPGGTNGLPDCDASNVNPGYLSAVMFWQFYFDPTTYVGQVKRALQANDQGRTNCLYQH